MATPFELDLEAMLAQLSALQPNSRPAWGQMSPQRMVEHLADALYMSMGQGEYTLEVPEERIERMQALRNERHAEMDQRAVAVKNFYSVLDAEQRKVLDGQHMMGLGGHDGHGRQGPHRGDHGGSKMPG